MKTKDITFVLLLWKKRLYRFFLKNTNIWKFNRISKIQISYNKIFKYKDTKAEYETNFVISDYVDAKKTLVLTTNKNLNRAIIDYSYRFGEIESIFLNQNSNRFFLESTVILYLTILEADFAKITKSYTNVKISTHTNSHGNKIRITSLFW